MTVTTLWSTIVPQRVRPTLLAAIPRPERPQPQRVELDEALRVLLVVGALVILDRHERRRVVRRALATFTPYCRQGEYWSGSGDARGEIVKFETSANSMLTAIRSASVVSCP